jgi:hypothetical protein
VFCFQFSGGSFGFFAGALGGFLGLFESFAGRFVLGLEHFEMFARGIRQFLRCFGFRHQSVNGSVTIAMSARFS